MIKHIWSVLCQRSVVDQETNNLSLFDILERLEVNINIVLGAEIPGELNLPIQYQVVSLWSKETNEGEVSAELLISAVDPSGNEHNLLQTTLRIPSDKVRMRSINTIQGLIANQDGIYTFRIKIKQHDEQDFQIVSELPLEVKVNRAAQASS